MLPDRIHVTGASGTGTTSLGRAIAQAHGHLQLDTDDFFWLPSDPPYSEKREPSERIGLLRRDLATSPRWVLSGSLCGWGDELIPQFQLVVFLTVPTPVRLARLRARENERFGSDATAPGGPLHDAVEAFLEWASLYDDGGLDVRSRALHETWLSRLRCPVVRLDGDTDLRQQLAELEVAFDGVT